MDSGSRVRHTFALRCSRVWAGTVDVINLFVEISMMSFDLLPHQPKRSRYQIHRFKTYLNCIHHDLSFNVSLLCEVKIIFLPYLCTCDYKKVRHPPLEIIFSIWLTCEDLLLPIRLSDLDYSPLHPATSPVIAVASPIDLRWSNRDCIPPYSCLSFISSVSSVHLFTAATFCSRPQPSQLPKSSILAPIAEDLKPRLSFIRRLA